MISVRTCKNCGKNFRGTERKDGRGNARLQTYCSRECSNEWKLSTAGISERFWSYVDKSAGPDGCWIWTGGTSPDGYGKFGHYSGGAKVTVRSHRFAFEEHGSTLGSLFACHHCDTPLCCNPKHMFAGTLQENNADRTAKGRTASGAHANKWKRSKLTPDSVRELRSAFASGAKLVDLAAKYGVSAAVIDMAVRRINWKWVD